VNEKIDLRGVRGEMLPTATGSQNEQKTGRMRVGDDCTENEERGRRIHHEEEGVMGGKMG
jgi:hypothetical protein